MDADAKKSATDAIIAKRDALLAERAQVRLHRSALATRDREIDRDLADCKAAARLFELDIEFPLDERDEAFREHLVRRAREVEIAARIAGKQQSPPLPQPLMPYRPQVSVTTEYSKPSPTAHNMPKIREIVLDQLRLAGPDGLKASVIQNYIRTTYEADIHEKTVGMTLYRLSLDKLVRREGRQWFLVSGATPEAENPGATTPGPTSI